MRTFVAVVALLGTSVSAAAAQPGQRCSHDVFPIGGQSVAVTACAAVQDQTVAVTEAIKATSGSLSHATTIPLLAGASVARGIDEVSLASLGLPYTLHLTLAVRDGQIAVEHALLLPGARPLK